MALPTTDGNLLVLTDDQEIALPATDGELVLLTEKLLEVEIPTNVFFQAIAIAAYDCASAFRYADNYLTNLKKAEV
ncbi:hypothetical protein VB735_08170 [Halotia wernerae UHCC 0503]|nr:hypothetical protein [Halotia wernerae UHCC 0503]